MLEREVEPCGSGVSNAGRALRGLVQRQHRADEPLRRFSLQRIVQSARNDALEYGAQWNVRSSRAGHRFSSTSL